MPTMLSEVYDAFIEAGASPEKSRRAAEAMTQHEQRFARIEAELLVLKWMVGTTVALDIAMMVMLLRLSIGR
jgi:hypothetical protein